jgi:hypothetical protein
LLEHVRSPVGVLAAAQRLLTPAQERLVGCHLTRETIDLVRHLGFTLVADKSRIAGIVRLVVARPPLLG